MMRLFVIRKSLLKTAVSCIDCQISFSRNKHIFSACEKLQKANFSGGFDPSYRTPLHVSPHWLKSQLEVKDKNLAVLDVTWTTKADVDAYTEFTQKHIPGAVHMNIFKGAKNTELLPKNIPNMHEFEETLQEVGVNGASHVVVYDSEGRGGFYCASRAAWQMKVYGKEKVSVLNGGLQMWESLGFPLTSDITEVKRGNFKGSHQRELMKTFEDLQSLLGKVQLVDNRSRDQYVKQSIKGAINVPFSTYFRDGALKTEEELKLLFENKQLDLNAPIVTYCNLGNLACSAAVALKLAGARDVSVYFGSLTEWKQRADPARLDSAVEKDANQGTTN